MKMIGGVAIGASLAFVATAIGADVALMTESILPVNTGATTRAPLVILIEGGETGAIVSLEGITERTGAIVLDKGFDTPDPGLEATTAIGALVSLKSKVLELSILFKTGADTGIDIGGAVGAFVSFMIDTLTVFLEMGDVIGGVTDAATGDSLRFPTIDMTGVIVSLSKLGSIDATVLYKGLVTFELGLSGTMTTGASVSYKSTVLVVLNDFLKTGAADGVSVFRTGAADDTIVTGANMIGAGIERDSVTRGEITRADATGADVTGSCSTVTIKVE